MERMRPKIKLKGAPRMTDSVLSEGSQDRLKGAPVDTDANIRHGEVFFPVITGGIKRKRAPRTGERKAKENLSFIFSRGSAMQSVPAAEDDLLDGDDKKGKEYAEEDLRMTDRRQVVTDSNQSNSELLEVKGMERVQQRHGHFKVKVKTFMPQEGSSFPLEKQQSSDNDNSHESLKEVHNPVLMNLEKPKSLYLKPVRSNDRPITPRQTGSRHNNINTSPHCNDMEKLHSYSENPEKYIVQIPEGAHQKHRRPPHAVEKDRTGQFEENKKELIDALMVVKKIMKMDAAEPFNTPVNPVALGIPDYFDVIDTPMDLGTICTALERGEKYRNSRDVFKDVQFIWENCYKYNSKGDPILDLMKRVKKNFVKYWNAAGLYYESPKRTPGMQYSVQGDITPTHEHCRVDESEMEHDVTGNPDGTKDTKTGKINFSAPAQLSGKYSGVKDEQVSVSVEHVTEENVKRAEKESQKTLEATKVQSCDQESKAEMNIAQAIVSDTPIINKGVKLRIKKSKLEIDAQENYGSNNEKADHISTGTDEESALKAGDSIKSLQEETKQQDPHPKMKTKRRHGKYHHKDGCLCAVCNARRRRYAREENALLEKGQSTVVDVDPSEKIKEKVIPRKRHSDEDGIKAEYASTADLIALSSEQVNEVKVDTQNIVDGEEKADPHKNGATEKHGQEGRKQQLPIQKEIWMNLEKEAQHDEEKDSFMQLEEESPVEQVEDEEQQEEKGSEKQQDDEVQEEVKDGQTQEEEETQQQDEGDGQQQEGESGRYSADYEIPLQYANPSITKMCEALFTRNRYSLWNRAHSLTYEPSKAVSENPILAAMSTFMN